jgi:acyl-CoA dehydrogenase
MYRAPVKDLRFVLDELLGTEQLRACPEFSEYSSETADAVLGEAARFAEMVLEPLCKSGDREGAHWSPDGVTMPEGFKEAYQQFCDNGWPALRSKAEFGGQNVPDVLGTAVEDGPPPISPSSSAPCSRRAPSKPFSTSVHRSRSSSTCRRW